MQFFDKNKVFEICQNNDVTFLGVFGSWSRGEATDKSDIDLLARFSKKKGLPDIVRIERKISETFGIKVDLLTEGAISPYLKDRIKKEMVVIYEG